MANRPKGYGMSAEVARKQAGKFDCDLALEAMEWIRDVLLIGSADAQALASKLPTEVTAMNHVHEPLKDGAILCHLINTLKPGSVKKINGGNMAFKQMENIANFLTGCENIGVNKTDLFQTVDLYENTNITQVVNGIYALGRKVQEVQGIEAPRLGPEESKQNIREFTDEQLRAGDGIIGLQAGSNKGASQAGQNFGKTRAIID